MKTYTLLIVLFTSILSVASAKELKDKIPRSFMPIAEMAEAIKKAEGKKLLVLVVKGQDDACPNCATALANGESAVGSGVIKLFARAETIGVVPSDTFSDALKQRIAKNFTSGAAVTFVVMSPDGKEVLAESDRDTLQDDHKGIAAFKTKIKDLKGKYK